MVVAATGVFGRWIDNRPMNTKMLLVIGVLAITTGVVGVVALSRMSALDERSTTMYDESVVPLIHAENLGLTMRKTRTDVLNHAVSQSGQNLSRYEKIISDDDALFEAQAAEYERE